METKKEGISWTSIQEVWGFIGNNMVIMGKLVCATSNVCEWKWPIKKTSIRASTGLIWQFKIHVA